MKRFNSMLLTGIVVMLMCLSACTRVTTGHVGVSTSFSGVVDPVELGQGWHQILFGEVDVYAANDISWRITHLTPQTKDRSQLEDLDLAYTYSVNPSSISDLVVKYKGQNSVLPDGAYAPLSLYVENVMKTATSDAVSKYDALEANEKREEIRQVIIKQAQEQFKEDGVDKDIRIHQVFIKNLQLSTALKTSANKVITSQNDLRAKEFEVQTAKKEAERLTLLSSNSANIGYINARANDKIADAILAGKVQTIVVPSNITMLGLK